MAKRRKKKKGKKKKMTVKESHEILISEESDKMIEQDAIIKTAKISTENNGISNSGTLYVLTNNAFIDFSGSHSILSFT